MIKFKRYHIYIMSTLLLFMSIGFLFIEAYLVFRGKMAFDVIYTFTCVITSCGTIAFRHYFLHSIIEVAIEGSMITFTKLNQSNIKVEMTDVLTVRKKLNGYVIILADGKKLYSYDGVSKLKVTKNNYTHQGILITDFVYAEYQE